MSAGTAAVADRLFDAISRGDLPAVDGLYGPDLVVWHNYDEVEQARTDSLRLLGWLCRKVGPLRYVEARRIVLPDGFVQQHVIVLGGACEGLRMPVMVRVFCDDRHIHRIEEYVDPGPLNARLAAAESA